MSSLVENYKKLKCFKCSNVSVPYTFVSGHTGSILLTTSLIIEPQRIVNRNMLICLKTNREVTIDNKCIIFCKINNYFILQPKRMLDKGERNREYFKLRNNLE